MIPDEAVEAAARALAMDQKAERWISEQEWEGIIPDRYKEPYRRQARLALVAAAPHLTAAALEDAAVALQDASSWSGSKPGPELIGRWLRSRAAAERRKVEQ